MLFRKRGKSERGKTGMREAKEFDIICLWCVWVTYCCVTNCPGTPCLKPTTVNYFSYSVGRRGSGGLQLGLLLISLGGLLKWSLLLPSTLFYYIPEFRASQHEPNHHISVMRRRTPCFLLTEVHVSEKQEVLWVYTPNSAVFHTLYRSEN